MFVSSLFCCLSFFNIGPVSIVNLNNDVFCQAMFLSLFCEEIVFMFFLFFPLLVFDLLALF